MTGVFEIIDLDIDLFDVLTEILDIVPDSLRAALREVERVVAE
jgi:hypothetical protein